MSLIEDTKKDPRLKVSITIILMLMVILGVFVFNEIHEEKSSYDYQSEISLLEERMESRYKQFSDEMYERLEKGQSENRQGFYMYNRRIESLENRVGVLENIARGSSISINNSNDLNMLKDVGNENSDNVGR